MSEGQKLEELRMVVNIDKELIPSVNRVWPLAGAKNASRWINDLIRRAIAGLKEGRE